MSETRVAVIGAVATIAAALIAAGTAVAISHPWSQPRLAAGTPATTAALTIPATSPTTSPPGSTTSAAATAAAGSDPAVRHATAPGSPVILELGHGVDLDSDAPDWADAVLETPQPELDVRIDGSSLVFRKTAAFLTAAPHRADCTTGTNMRDEVLLIGAPKTMYACVHTSEGRWSGLTITVLDINDLALDITTWQ
jgi:hypothetical protein